MQNKNIAQTLQNNSSEVLTRVNIPTPHLQVTCNIFQFTCKPFYCC